MRANWVLAKKEVSLVIDLYPDVIPGVINIGGPIWELYALQSFTKLALEPWVPELFRIAPLGGTRDFAVRGVPFNSSCDWHVVFPVGPCVEAADGLRRDGTIQKLLRCNDVT